MAHIELTENRDVDIPLVFFSSMSLRDFGEFEPGLVKHRIAVAIENRIIDKAYKGFVLDYFTQRDTNVVENRGGAFDNWLRHMGRNGVGFTVDFDASNGSIIIKNGEVRIKATWLIVFLAMVTGSLDFLKNYEQYRAGYSALVVDIEQVLSTAKSEIEYFEFSDIQTGMPLPGEVYETLQIAYRREDLHMLIEENLQSLENLR